MRNQEFAVSYVPLRGRGVRLRAISLRGCIIVTVVYGAVGTPALTLIGATGAALMTALASGGLLVAVAVIPFTIPVLIFGVSASYAVIAGPAPFMPPFVILIALTLVAAVIAPIAGAAALRVAAE